MDLSALADDVVSHLSVLAEEKRQTLSVDRRASPVVSADRLVLRQALINLVDNAIKFTPASGHVRIRIDQTAEDAVVEVIDPAGASAAGVPVTHKIYAGTDEQTRTVATDARGRAVFSDLPAGASINAVLEADAAHPKLISNSTTLGAVALGTIVLRRNNSPAK